MNLQEYFQSLPFHERKSETLRLARILGISKTYMYFIRQGKRRFPEKFAVIVEKSTNGKVTREALCPHMYN